MTYAEYRPIVIKTQGDPITIRFEHIVDDDCFGYFDERTGDVVVERDMEPFGIATVLTHELLHVAESMAKQSGLIKRNAGENYVTNVMPILAGLMACAGMLEGVSREDVYAEMEANE